MTDQERAWESPPWEPPLAGTESEQLIGAIERQRATFQWKTEGLDAAGLRKRIDTSALTLGGLLKHLALVEDYTFATKLNGEPIGPPWDAIGWDGSDAWDEWEFTSALDDSPQELYALWNGAVARSRARLKAALRNGALDQPTHMGPASSRASLRRLLCDHLEAYGRHTGHADLLREAVDGRVGEDPPAGWQPGGLV
ncbi:MAG: DUF664 domain-containing protein [Streptosporangiaceae bacterium]